MSVYEKGERIQNVIKAILIRHGYDPITNTYIASVGKCERKSCGGWNINHTLLGSEIKKSLRCAGCGYNLREVSKEKYIKKYWIKNHPIII